MNIDSINKWLMLAANLGVIAGIIFLAIEINQNSELLQAQVSYNHKETRSAFGMASLNYDGLAEIIIKVDNGVDLSPIKKI